MDGTTLRDLVLRNRSYRRFDEQVAVSYEQMLAFLECGRLSPSGGNLQALKFIISCDQAKNDLIFPHLAWAAYLEDWPGPAPGERPAAYFVILLDKELGTGGIDHGIAAQSMLLAATAAGLGGCMIQSIKRDALRADLGIPARYEIVLVVAIGKPQETVVVDELSEGGSVRYWRDGSGVHHVPKRSLKALVLNL